MFREQIDYRTSGFRIWLFARSRAANYGPLGALGVTVAIALVMTVLTIPYARLVGVPASDMNVALSLGLVAGLIIGGFLSAMHVATPGIDEAYDHCQRALRFGLIGAERGYEDARSDFIGAIAAWQGYRDGRPRGFANS